MVLIMSESESKREINKMFIWFLFVVYDRLEDWISAQLHAGNWTQLEITSADDAEVRR